MNLWIDSKFFAHARLILASNRYLLFDDSWGDIDFNFAFKMDPVESFNQVVEDDVIAVW